MNEDKRSNEEKSSCAGADPLCIRLMEEQELSAAAAGERSRCLVVLEFSETIRCTEEEEFGHLLNASSRVRGICGDLMRRILARGAVVKKKTQRGREREGEGDWEGDMSVLSSAVACCRSRKAALSFPVAGMCCDAHSRICMRGTQQERERERERERGREREREREREESAVYEDIFRFHSLSSISSRAVNVLSLFPTEPLRERDFQKLLKSSSSASLTTEALHNAPGEHTGTPAHHGSLVLITEKRQPLSSVSSLEVHFDLLDLTELTDTSDQELGEVFNDSDEENHSQNQNYLHQPPFLSKLTHSACVRSPSWTPGVKPEGLPRERTHHSDSENSEPVLKIERSQSQQP
ncbi:hypothetical protein DNTS_011869 [Danionella cerebrum]|uniref:Dysbindin domain-containing protein 1 n=1 Tax=Danionella cerebrum TaxID=2873325 RepID=A0A553Q7C8_9TELE|nr:hypothetical protein DNTS_011869 [Danionella translucida]TRY85832.1 hypothetical protein DNTS_011869 [Danionella translucida]